MFIEYKAMIGAIHFWTIWGFIIFGFLFVRDANVRWFIVFFSGVHSVSYFASTFSKLMGHSIFFHLWLVFCSLIFLKTVIYRPYICERISHFWGRLFYPLNTIAEWVLPSKSVWVIYPAELGLQRIYKGFVFCNLLAVLNYGLAYLGITSKGGWLDSHGINRLIVWDFSYAMNLVLLFFEIILFVFLVFRGLKNNFSLKL